MNQRRNGIATDHYACDAAAPEYNLSETFVDEAKPNDA